MSGGWLLSQSQLSFEMSTTITIAPLLSRTGHPTFYLLNCWTFYEDVGGETPFGLDYKTEATPDWTSHKQDIRWGVLIFSPCWELWLSYCLSTSSPLWISVLGRTENVLQDPNHFSSSAICCSSTLRDPTTLWWRWGDSLFLDSWSQFQILSLLTAF